MCPKDGRAVPVVRQALAFVCSRAAIAPIEFLIFIGVHEQAGFPTLSAGLIGSRGFASDTKLGMLGQHLQLSPIDIITSPQRHECGVG